MKDLGKITTVLILIGALNWGIIGLFDYDVFESVLGDSWVNRLLGILIGFSAVYKVVNWNASKGK